MNNNNLGRVSVRTSKRKRTSTPLHYDVNATASVGEIIPFMVREVEPDSKVSLKTRNLIRLATMVVPTYGRLRLNLRHYFVGIGDLTENFGALLAEQTIARGKYSFRPSSLPFVSKGFLSLFSLVGSHVTLYRFSTDAVADTDDDMGCELYKVAFGNTEFTHSPYSTIFEWFNEPSYGSIPSSSVESAVEYMNDNKFYTQHMPEFMRDAWGGYDGPALNIAKLIPVDGQAFPADAVDYEFWIPIENKSWETLFELRAGEGNTPPGYYDTSVVPLATADAVISVKPKVDGNHYCFLASRFSSFGSRWYNLLISSGLGVDYADFTTDGVKSVMPLFAYYKAYWESFGLTLYKKWETSAVYRMLQYYDHFNDYDFGNLISLTAQRARDNSITIGIDVPQYFFQHWCNFVMDVCTAFYTEEQDFVSAHTRTATVSPAGMDVPLPDANSPATDNDNLRVIATPNQPTDITSDKGVPYVFSAPFSQLDLETLKRLYKVVNRNTIAGQRIATLLDMQGLGDYVNSCKSRFIGEHNVDIDIDEVTATSDFFDSEGDPRSLLGEQGGKGVGFGVSKNFSVSTREFGYYIVLASVVPEAGYVNVSSASGRNLRKHDFYNPEYDGLGMELNPLELTVSGVQDFSDSSERKLSGIGFGFVPRYSRHKVQSNLALGGFAKRSERSYYRTYFMDKIIDVGERAIQSYDSTDNRERFLVHKLAKASLVPLSSPEYRFVGRYPWLENYLRIFAETGDPRRNNYIYYRNLSDFSNLFFDFCFRDEGKFILQNRMLLNASVPWLKITDAYETKEDGNVGSTDTSVGKS